MWRSGPAGAIPEAQKERDRRKVQCERRGEDGSRGPEGDRIQQVVASWNGNIVEDRSEGPEDLKTSNGP